MTTRYAQWQAAKARFTTVETRAAQEAAKGPATLDRLTTEAAKIQDEDLRAFTLAEAEKRGQAAIQSHGDRAKGMAAKEKKVLDSLHPGGKSISNVSFRVDPDTGDLCVTKRENSSSNSPVVQELCITPEVAEALGQYINYVFVEEE